MDLIEFCRKVSTTRDQLMQQFLDEQAAQSAENSLNQTQTSFFDFQQQCEAEKVELCSHIHIFC